MKLLGFRCELENGTCLKERKLLHHGCSGFFQHRSQPAAESGRSASSNAAEGFESHPEGQHQEQGSEKLLLLHVRNCGGGRQEQNLRIYRFDLLFQWGTLRRRRTVPEAN
ncbi:AAEL012620-PA [Aedes aegypti]|uniref:AAEL012620-PA n=1 Tax=Aedes aegypti TaxID=7159 RepID=Q16LK9_AEDAE|nr:AAEL012620-PA [Aedes aegypti]